MWLRRIPARHFTASRIPSDAGFIRSPFALLLTAYDELARDRWIFEHSAQTTITVSRTYYTHEVCPDLADHAWDAQELGGFSHGKRCLTYDHTVTMPALTPCAMQVDAAFDAREDGNENALKVRKEIPVACPELMQDSPLSQGSCP